MPDKTRFIDASAITSGELDTARIPDLDAAKIISGILDPTRIPFTHGTLANRPTPSTPNRYYWATDVLTLYRDTGTDWEAAGAGPPNLLATRYYDAGGYYDPATGTIAVRAPAVEDAVAHICTWRRFGYGTYDWYARIVNPGANKVLFVGFGEIYSSSWIQGVIAVYIAGSDYYFTTGWAGSDTDTVLSGQDWTTERHFRIVWASGSAKLYVDDMVTPVATHNTNIPTEDMVKFIEILHEAVAPANVSAIYARDLFF